MKVLVISNMYPNKKYYYGSFIKAQIESLENIGIEIVKVVENTYKNNLLYFPFFIKCITAISFRKYNLIHAHYGFHSALIPLIFKTEPVIVTFHGSDINKEIERNIIYYKLHKYVVSKSNHIIVVSEEVKDKIVATMGIDPNKITKISCGVDTYKFRPMNKKIVRNRLNIDENAKIVIFVGNLIKNKGLDLIFESAKKLQDITFLFIGDGPLTSNLDNCIFVGSVNSNEIPTWLNVADIFILPSMSEGTPVALLEAMACGLPAIATNVGDCCEIIKENETGFLINKNNADSLSIKIRYLFNNPWKISSFGTKARQNIVEKYDLKIVARKIKQVYERHNCYE